MSFLAPPSDYREDGNVKKETCPCQYWTDEKLMEAPRSAAETDSLIKWLSGVEFIRDGDCVLQFMASDSEGGVPGSSEMNKRAKFCADGGRKCSNRVRASFFILNGLRDACEKFFDGSVSVNSAESKLSKGEDLPTSKETSVFHRNGRNATNSYENDCPSLTNSSTTMKSGKVAEEERVGERNSGNQTTILEMGRSNRVPALQGKNMKQRIRPVDANNPTLSLRSNSMSDAAGENVSFFRGKIQMPRTVVANGKQPRPTPWKRNKQHLSTLKGNTLPMPNGSFSLLSDSSKSKDGFKRRITPSNITSLSSCSPTQFGQKPDVLAGNIASLRSANLTDMFKRGSPMAARNTAYPSSTYHCKAEPNADENLEAAVYQNEGSKQTSLGDVKNLLSEAGGVNEIEETIGDGDCTEAKEGQVCEPTRCPISASEISSQWMPRFVQVYLTLIRSDLVPSTALELHLVIRLLTTCMVGENIVKSSLDRAMKNTAENQLSLSFEYLFPTAKEARSFASSSLRMLKSVVKDLGHGILKELLACSVLEDAVPDVLRDLRNSIDENCQIHALESNVQDYVTLRRKSGAAIYSVPFDNYYDCRNSCRTQEDTVAFSNREECRDAFLFQIRGYEGVRGKLLRASDAKKYADEVTADARRVLGMLFPGNRIWFAKIFCHLLIQVGLATVEETDSEILKKVSDAPRLQKLSQRLTSKGGQLTRSSQKLVVDAPGRAALSYNLLPGHLFHGYQEFFYLFIMSADSLWFGVHLRRRLVQELELAMRAVNVRGFVERSFKAKLLGKFLGLLSFSPYWQQPSEKYPHIVVTRTGSSNLSGAVSQADFVRPPVDLIYYIINAWKSNCVAAVIPWVVDFFSMIRWDYFSQSSPYYCTVLGLLRSIQLQLRSSSRAGCALTGSTLQLMKLNLEYLFGDIIGLDFAERMVALVDKDILEKFQAMERGVFAWQKAFPADLDLDHGPICISLDLVFSLSSHLEELMKMLLELKCEGLKVSSRGAASRKLRPTSVQYAPVSSLSLSRHSLFDEYFPTLTPRMKESAQEMLVDSFFHHHQDIKDIADLVVETCVRDVCAYLTSQDVSVAVTKKMCNLPSLLKSSLLLGQALELTTYNMILSDIEADVRAACDEKLTKTCEEKLKHLMRSLISNTSPMAVINTAIFLAESRTRQRIVKFLDVAVQMECRKVLDAHLDMLVQECGGRRSEKRGSSDMCSEMNESSSWIRDFTNIVTSIENQFHLLDGTSPSSPDIHEMQETCNRICQLAQHLNESYLSVEGKPPNSAKMFGRLVTTYLAVQLQPKSSQQKCDNLKKRILSASTYLLSLFFLQRPTEPELCAPGTLITQNLLSFLSWDDGDIFCPHKQCESLSPGEELLISEMGYPAASLLAKLMEVGIASMYELESDFLMAIESGHSRASHIARLVIRIVDSCPRQLLRHQPARMKRLRCYVATHGNLKIN